MKSAHCSTVIYICMRASARALIYLCVCVCVYAWGLQLSLLLLTELASRLFNKINIYICSYLPARKCFCAFFVFVTKTGQMSKINMAGQFARLRQRLPPDRQLTHIRAYMCIIGIPFNDNMKHLNAAAALAKVTNDNCKKTIDNINAKFLSFTSSCN